MELDVIEIKEGQLFSFHKDPKEPFIVFVDGLDRQGRIDACGIVMEVTEIDGFIGVTPLKDRTGWFQVGNQYIAKKSDVIHSGNYRLIWDPDIECGEFDKEEEYGANCAKCKNYFPDAVKANDFKCWACRNGF